MAANENPIRSIIVIGGGLGGTAFAQAIKRSAPNIKVSVYERDISEDHRHGGYQIGLQQDTIRRLAQLGLPLEPIFTRDHIPFFSMVNSNYELLAKLGKEFPSTKLEDMTNALVERRSLRKVLADGLDIHWNKKFVRYEVHDQEVTAFFEDETQVTADFLVGADGWNSKVRPLYCPDLQVKPAGYHSMAGAISMPSESEIPRLFPLLKDSPVRVLTSNGYSILYLANHNEEGQRYLTWVLSHRDEVMIPPVNQPDTKEKYQELVRDWNDPDLSKIVELTKNEDINFMWMYKHGSCPVKNPKVTTNRVALLGDAIHPMTSHMGLGANTAFLDAFDLADAIIGVSSEDELIKRLHQYNQKSMQRGWKNANASLQSSSMSHKTGWVASMRNGFMYGVGTLMSLFSR